MGCIPTTYILPLKPIFLEPQDDLPQNLVGIIWPIVVFCCVRLDLSLLIVAATKNPAWAEAIYISSRNSGSLAIRAIVPRCRHACVQGPYPSQSGLDAIAGQLCHPSESQSVCSEELNNTDCASRILLQQCEQILRPTLWATW